MCFFLLQYNGFFLLVTRLKNREYLPTILKEKKYLKKSLKNDINMYIVKAKNNDDIYKRKKKQVF